MHVSGKQPHKLAIRKGQKEPWVVTHYIAQNHTGNEKKITLYMTKSAFQVKMLFEQKVLSCIFFLFKKKKEKNIKLFSQYQFWFLINN